MKTDGSKPEIDETTISNPVTKQTIPDYSPEGTAIYSISIARQKKAIY
jgi:hypothetical protein